MSTLSVTAATEVTIGQINEMSNRTQDRIDTARSISRRLGSLRVRLIGGVEEANAKADTSAPEPVRPEVDGLSHNVNVLGDILREIDSDLSALEGL